MKINYNTEFNDFIVYEESIITGKRAIVINGQTASVINNRKGEYNIDESLVKVKGNAFTGINIEYNGGQYNILKKLTLLELLFSLLPIAVIIQFFIGPVASPIGRSILGPIGGVIAFLATFSCIYVLRKVENKFLGAFLSILIAFTGGVIVKVLNNTGEAVGGAIGGTIAVLGIYSCIYMFRKVENKFLGAFLSIIIAFACIGIIIGCFVFILIGVGISILNT